MVMALTIKKLVLLQILILSIISSPVGACSPPLALPGPYMRSVHGMLPTYSTDIYHQPGLSHKHIACGDGGFWLDCREYRDVTSNTGLPTSTAYPTRDENGHILTTEFGMCVYKNHQVITIQVS